MTIFKRYSAKLAKTTDAQKASVKVLETKLTPLQLSPEIFPQNMTRPVVKAELPLLGARISHTPQLVFCNHLLPRQPLLPSLSSTGMEPASPASSENSTRSNIMRLDESWNTWLEAIEQDPTEQDRLRWLPKKLVDEFANEVTNNATAIAKAVLLGPIFDRETYRNLLCCFISKFEATKLLDIDLLQGLVQLVQSASSGYLVDDDLIWILRVLYKRFEATHFPDLEEKKHLHPCNHVLHLTVATSRLLDIMVEDKDQRSCPLRDLLHKLRTFDDPYLRFQVAYAYNALQHVPDDETTLQMIMRFAGGLTMATAGAASVFKIDPESLIMGIGNIQQAIAHAHDIAKSIKEGAQSLRAGGEGIVDSILKSFVSGQKRAWYLALHGAQVMIRNGQLADFKEALLALACRHDRDFQWGICQLLGEIIHDPLWDNSTQLQAINCLGELYNNQDWGRDVSIKKWILTILRQISYHPDPTICGQSNTLLLSLRKDGHVAFSLFYPMGARLPLPSRSPLLANVQEIPLVDFQLNKLKIQRLAEERLAVYIPPRAIPNLNAPTDRAFPLLEKVQEFLASPRHVFLILGASGAGKSTFNSFLERDLLTNYSTNRPFPLYINLPAIDHPETDMIAKQLSFYNFSDAQIQELKEHRQFVLICDGYDKSHLETNLYVTNQLNRPESWNVKMIISCRSTYLGLDYQDQFRPQANNRYHSDSANVFQEVVIAPFSAGQIHDYVKQFVRSPETQELFDGRPVWSAQEYLDKLLAIPNMMDLVKNPFLLSLSLRTLPLVVQDVLDLSKIVMTRLVLYDKNLLNDGFELNVICYLKKLASAIFREQNGNPVVHYSNYKDKDTWKAEFFSPESAVQLLRESSPLSRTGIQYQFIHGSLLDWPSNNPYLQHFIPAVSQPATNPAGQTSTNPFLRASTNPLNKTSDNPFSLPTHTSDAIPRVSTSRSTPRPRRDSIERRAPQILPGVESLRSKNPLDGPLSQRNLAKEPTILQFLAERVQGDPEFKKKLFAMIEQSKTEIQASQSAANAITILVRAGVRFNGMDLKGIRIPGANLSGGEFDSTHLQGADLTDVNLSSSWLRQTDLSRAKMDGIQFGESQYLREYFSVHSCRYSPDGRKLAVGCSDGIIRVYNAESLERLYIIPAHISAVTSLAFSPRVQELSSASEGTSVKLWDTQNGGRGPELIGHTNRVTCLAYSRNGMLVASGSWDRTVRLWFVSGRHNHANQAGPVLVGHENCVTSIAFSPNDREIALGTVIEGHTDWVLCVAYSPAGRHIASGSQDMTIRLLDATTTDTNRFVWVGHTDAVTCVAFSVTGEQVVTGGKDSTVRLWDPLTGTPGAVFGGHSGTVTTVAYSPNGQSVISGSTDKTIRFWDSNSQAVLRGLNNHSDAISGVAFSKDGRHIVSGGHDQTVRNWDAESGVPISVLRGHTRKVNAVAFSPTGLQVASGGEDKTVRLWCARTGRQEFVWNNHTESVTTVAFTPSGEQLASGSEDNTILVLNPTTGERMHLFRGHDLPVSSLSFSPPRNWLVSGSWDSTVRFWDVRFGGEGPVWQGHTEAVSAVDFSPSGAWIVTGGKDNTARVWDLQSANAIFVLSGHTQAVEVVTVSPNGQFVATGSQDGTVRLWEVTSGQCLVVIGDFFGDVNSLCWKSSTTTNDGEMMFATGCKDKSVRVWRLIDEGGGRSYRVRLVWSSTCGGLVLSEAILEGANGLTWDNRPS
ncbi:WD_REPEATS_REGION domain-containing protein [Haplosporangium gracile]|nr:WD_REPEATS_REGION domain-containing protein [Haplosporangium gracile]